MSGTPPSTSPDSSNQLLEEILVSLRERGCKRTSGLVEMVKAMIAHPQPASLADWARLPALQHRDPVTLYRLMLKLEAAGLVRRVYLGERAQHFQLIQPGRQSDYLVCTSCGELEEVEEPPEVRSIASRLASQSGWKGVRHELEFFGLCPKCAAPAG